ncbi:Superfamily II DNA or RNA helicase, SNF2 family [Ruminococcus flavefaciens]|uniref:Superfamily II DNA or RNA helicase, SNF2 family n=2 Tax=Ruminococcus flavefaciens TaxID=1265 RepID=A0A1M7IGI0_RUMFL|nr:Superfamily II DNA or RNA helicase, SNF2 family [Ruminococcus flavefaciens]
MITINSSASKKNGFLIIETYYTKKVDSNKSGKFKGGVISSANIYSNIPIENCSLSAIAALFKEECQRLSENAYYVTVPSLKRIVDKLKPYKMIFLDNRDKSLVLVENIILQKHEKKVKHKYAFGDISLCWYADCTLYIEEESTSGMIIKQKEPVPHMQYSKEEQIYSLYFCYNGENIAFLDKKLSITNGDMILLRNYSYEHEIGESILKEKFTKLAGSRFIYSGHKNTRDIVAFLSSKSIVLDDDENTIIPDIKVTKNESGWFEIDLSYQIDGEVFDLASKIQLFSSQDEIEDDDKKILLPDSIIQAREYLSVVGNKLRIDQNHIFELLHIIYDSNSDISEFFSYSDIMLALPDHVTSAAYPYQLEGIKWLKFLFLNHFGGCLADDMGLGKTFQIISFLEDQEVKNNIKKVLIIVPKSLLTNWKKEFEKFNSVYRVGIYHGDKRNEFDFENTDVIITTYNTAYLDLKNLNELVYSLVVFDEIQTIKNHKSITSDAMKQIRSEMKIGLSGTPMENSISELWNIMDVLNPNVFYSHSAFMRRYSGKNYDELKSILNLFILRRMKKDVLKELPQKSEQIIYCDMEQEQRKLYTSINVAVKKAIMSLKAFAAPVVLKGLTLLRECCCHPMLLNDETNVDKVYESCKLDALDLLVDNLVGSGHKILIFSNYTSMLHLIQEELEKNEHYKKIIYYLDGKTKNRVDVVKQFESADEGIFLISIKAGGVGLNLVSAQDVIIYDPWWNPFVEQQAVDRAYRIGQDKPVTVYKLVAANTIEERIVEMQKDKEQDFDELINGISTDKNIDLKDIIELLQ